MTGRVKINLTCDRPFYDAAVKYAGDRGKSVSAVMREALIERMDRERAAEAELRSQMRVGSAAVNEILRGPFK